MGSYFKGNSIIFCMTSYLSRSNDQILGQIFVKLGENVLGDRPWHNYNIMEFGDQMKF